MKKLTFYEELEDRCEKINFSMRQLFILAGVEPRSKYYLKNNPLLAIERFRFMFEKFGVNMENVKGSYSEEISKLRISTMPGMYSEEEKLYTESGYTQRSYFHIKKVGDPKILETYRAVMKTLQEKEREFEYQKQLSEPYH